MNTIYVATVYLSEYIDMEHITALDRFSVKKKLLQFLIDYIRDVHSDKFEKFFYPHSIEYIMDENEEHLDRRLDKIKKFLIKEEKDPQITISKINTDISNNKVTDISLDYL